MIRVRLGKSKVFVPQLIDKLPVKLAAVNLLILSAIARVFYAVRGLHKADISCGIAYETAAVEYCLVTNILVEIHVII